MIVEVSMANWDAEWGVEQAKITELESPNLYIVGENLYSADNYSPLKKKIASRLLLGLARD